MWGGRSFLLNLLAAYWFVIDSSLSFPAASKKKKLHNLGGDMSSHRFWLDFVSFPFLLLLKQVCFLIELISCESVESEAAAPRRQLI